MKKKMLWWSAAALVCFSLGFFTHAKYGEDLDAFLARASTIGYVRIVRDVDGDTIRIQPWWGPERSVRLIGIDTPETVKSGSAVECYGPESSAHMKKLLADHELVRIVFDPTQGTFDLHGRLVAYAYFWDGTFLNRHMIEQGYAEEWTYGRVYRYRDEFRAAEQQARAKRLGRWGACGLDSKKHKK